MDYLNSSKGYETNSLDHQDDPVVDRRWNNFAVKCIVMDFREALPNKRQKALFVKNIRFFVSSRFPSNLVDKRLKVNYPKDWAYLVEE